MAALSNTILAWKASIVATTSCPLPKAGTAATSCVSTLSHFRARPKCRFFHAWYQIVSVSISFDFPLEIRTSRTSRTSRTLRHGAGSTISWSFPLGNSCISDADLDLGLTSLYCHFQMILGPNAKRCRWWVPLFQKCGPLRILRMLGISPRT